MRKVFKVFLSILLLVVCVSCVVGCNNTPNYDTSSDSDYSSESTVTSITSSQAISIAKSSSKVVYKIVDLFDLKFYYTPDWGTTYASKWSNGDWEVDIKGTISGYTDDYKTDFVYDQKFSVTVIVDSFGNVGNVYASKVYW